MRQRYRLVTRQDGGAPHVSSKVLGWEELAEHLATEALLHTLGGWKVSASESGLVCRRGKTVRTITFRASDAFSDSTEGSTDEEG